MASKIKYHLDEHVDHAIARALRSRGIDVSTSVEMGLISASDEEQLEYANQNNCVLLTHDEDFLLLHALGVSHAGICYCHQSKHSIGDLLRMLLLVHDCLTADEMRNHLEFL